MGRKPSASQLTPVELEIMKILWAQGASTVQAVREKIPGPSRPAYTSVQTMLNVLHRKGKVKRILKGRSFEYLPKVSKEGAASVAIRDVLDRLFGGSAEDLVMTLIRDRHITPGRLAELKALVEPSAKTAAPKEKRHAND
jgi:BlaI family transcriptional regulator, penicillinase repressor